MSGMRDLFQAMGVGEHGQGRTGNFKFRETEHKGWGALSTYKLLYET